MEETWTIFEFHSKVPELRSKQNYRAMCICKI